jgi:hypothetical protein
MTVLTQSRLLLVNLLVRSLALSVSIPCYSMFSVCCSPCILLVIVILAIMMLGNHAPARI